MKGNVKDLNLLLVEYNQLSNKTLHTKKDSHRMAYLQSAMAAVKEGASLRDFDIENLNDMERRNGLPLTQVDPFALSHNEEVEAHGWQEFVEKRDMVGGNPISRIGTYTGLGNFVPTGFFPQLYAALGAHDILFNEADCTVMKSSNGRITTIPLMGDIEIVAGIVGEGGSQSSVDFSNTGQAVLGVYTYNSKRFVASLESFQDLGDTLSVVELAKRAFASRLARGIGADLMNGNGSSKPLGLIPALEAAGVVPVVANGSAGNTGGAETGANSLGSADFSNALAHLDSAYLSSDKLAWAMNRKTLNFLNGLVNKVGAPLNLVQYVDCEPFIYGVPVKISPSVPDIGASSTPVILGDFSYWCTKLVMDENVGLQVYKEGPGLAEAGNIGLSCFVRGGGALLYNDTSSPAPFVLIQNHS
jgi:HK97 family phage major capsid protein